NEAIKDFNRAIELDSDYKWAIANRGATYQFMECYDKALKDFNRTIELDSDYKWTIADRGVTYRLMERYNEAIKDFNRAIELDPKYDWAIANRGKTYRLMERYNEAIKDFDRAIELDPKYEWCISERAWLQQTLGNYEKSAEDFTRLVKLSSEKDQYIIAGRGLNSLLRGNYGSALEDLNHAMELDENPPIYCCRALTYVRLKEIEQAKKDISQAIKLAQKQYEEDPNEHRNTCNLGLYYLIVRKPDQAKFFYQEALTRGVSVSTLRDVIDDLKKLLIILPNHPHTAGMQSFLESNLSLRQINV
ncbi:tpr repeat-containing protein, partial [Leptolyngbya sp. Heron Island J]|uniref:tetratricopeptide repeat protein n=1 Tax=Leptolyngbya sp. Heron Island J TaxID=1385935 RepID=UPI0003B95240